MSDSPGQGSGGKLFNFRGGVDINTIIVLVAFLGGGMMFVANTNAKMDAKSDEMRQFERQTQNALDRLSVRIDNFVDGHPK